MNVVCIIQARMGSTRLKSKVLKEIDGKPLIYYVLNQTSKSELIDKVVVASTTNPNDKILIETVEGLGYGVFAGSEEDVLDRYYQTAKKFSAEVIVRVTADCPLIDPEVIDKVIKIFQENSCDYCSNVHPPSYPDGLDIEVFSFTALGKAWREAKLPSEREHVTFYFTNNKDKFKINNVENDKDLSSLRLTVDEQEDFVLISKLVNKINKSPVLLRDILALFDKEPELLEINKKFERNEGHAKAFEKDKLVMGNEKPENIDIKKVFVTGGCGFIGSNFIRLLLSQRDYHIVNYDALTYAGNPDNLKDISSSLKYTFIKGDICDKEKVLDGMKGCDVVVNFAAESHVDRSIKNAGDFINTNIIGTMTLLDSARGLGIKRFIQIGTDEVYGALLDEDSSRTENDILRPSSPYSSSKASADLIAMSYYITHGLPVIITRSSNNYGPYQYPEKLIPLFITNIIENKKVPLMGKGENIRDWIHVGDNCLGILHVMEKGRVGEIYNISGEDEKTNMEITKTILGNFDKDISWIEEIPHRLGHDFRYSLDSSKIKQLGWEPKYTFEKGIQETISWYTKNKIWWQKLKGGEKK